MTRLPKILSILLLFLLASCSIQKRSYMRGFHIEWKNTGVKTKVGIKEALIVAKPALKEKTPNLTASTKKQEPGFVYTGLPTLIDTVVKKPCDSLFMRKGGDVLTGKVTEINPNEIKYRRCDNPDGPLIVLTKNDIHFIKYANGSIEEIPYDSPGKAQNIEKKLSEMQVEQNTRASLIYSIAGLPLLLLGGLGVIFSCYGARYGWRALKNMRNDAKLQLKYRNRALLGFWLGILTYSLIGLLLILFASAFVGSLIGVLFVALFLFGLGFIFVF